MDAKNRAPRVNKALMAKFIGQKVRLIGKVVTQRADVAIVMASDEAEVETSILPGFEKATPFVEVIGEVKDARTLKMLGWVDFGDDVDLKLADQILQIWHDPKFASVF